jgi:hypothetical protein
MVRFVGRAFCIMRRCDPEAGAIMTSRAPDLVGAWIERVESSDGGLILFVDGVRRFGLLFGGRIIFEGVSKLEGTDPRLPSGAPTLTGGMTVRAQRSEPGTTLLVLVSQTWPGDEDEPQFAIFPSAGRFASAPETGSNRAGLGRFLPASARPNVQEVACGTGR